jgi:hypothetical protein
MKMVRNSKQLFDKPKNWIIQNLNNTYTFSKIYTVVNTKRKILKNLSFVFIFFMLFSIFFPSKGWSDYEIGNPTNFSGFLTNVGGAVNVGAQWAWRFTAQRSGTIDNVYLYLRFGSNWTAAVAIYTVDPDDPDNPFAGTIVGSTSTANVTVTGWYSFTLNRPSLTQGQQYWLVVDKATANRWDQNGPYFNIIAAGTEFDAVSGNLDPDFLMRAHPYGSGWTTYPSRLPIWVITFTDGEPYFGNTYTASNTFEVHNNNTANPTDDQIARQIFVPASTVRVGAIKIYGSKSATTQAGASLLIEIYSDPFGANTLISSVTIPSSSFDTGYQWTPTGGQFFQSIQLTAGQYYALVFKSTGAITNTGSGFTIWGARTNNNTSPRPQGTFGSSGAKGQTSTNNGSTWSDITPSGDFSFRFIIDETPPNQTIDAPANNSFWATPPVIRGTAQDSNGILRFPGPFELKIYNETTGNYWTGSGWSMFETWFTTSPASIPGAGGVLNWAYNTSVFVSHNGRYTVVCRAVDASGNYSLTYSTITFTYDIYSPGPPEQPDSRVLSPSNGSYYSSSRIEGTADDNTKGGIAGIQIAIRRETDNYYWDQGGGIFQQNFVWNTVPTSQITPLNSRPVTWYFVISNPSQFQSGVQYKVWTRAFDLVTNPTNNTELVFTTNTFTWDVQAPTSSITYPQQYGYVGTNPIFYGGYYDAVSGIDPTKGKVEVLLYDKTTGKYYWGGDWQSIPPPTPDDWPDASVWPTSWTYISPPLTGGREYLLISRARDFAGNYQTDFPVGIASNTFTCDNQKPVSTITTPNSSFRNQLSTITGTAEDLPATSNVSNVDIEIVYPAESPAYVWNGSSWVSYSTSFSTYVRLSGGYPNWTYSVPDTINWQQGVTYRIRTRAIDTVGNSEDSWEIGRNERTFKYDVSYPTSTVTKFTQDGIEISTTQTNYFHNISLIQGLVNEYPPSPYGNLAGVYVYIEKIDLPGQGCFWDDANKIWRNDLGAVKNNGVLTAYGWSFDTTSISFSTGSEGGCSWSGGGTFRVRTEARDSAEPGNRPPPSGNREKNGIYANLNFFDFVFDVYNAGPPERPNSYLTNVADGDFKNYLPQIQGVASDEDSSVSYTPVIDKVKIHIYDKINNRTYNGNSNPSNWDNGDLLDNAHWFDTNFVGVSSGTFTFNSPNWQHTIEYRLITKAYDKAGNYERILSTVSFVYDTYVADPESPNSYVTSPSNNQHFNYKFTQITGDSQDNVRGQISGVKLKILRLPNPYLGESTTYYWSRTQENWSSADPNSNISDWPDAVASDGSFNSNYEPWYFNTPQSGAAGANFWQPGRVYLVASRATDKATNNEIVFTTITFIYELDRPTATITYPIVNGYVSQTGKVTGIAADNYPGKVSNVYVRIKRDDNLYYQIGSGWVSSSVFNDVVTNGYLSPNATYWYLNASPWESGRTYTIDAYAVDLAGNYQIIYSTSANVKADFDAPSSTITWPVHNGDYDIPVTHIDGDVSDLPPGQIDKVQLSYQRVDTGKYWDGSGWNSDTEMFFDATVYQTSWTATGASTPNWYTTLDGVYYKVFARAIDKAGNITPKPANPAAGTSYIQFKLRTPAPTSTITSPDASVPHWKLSPLPAIRGTAQYATGVKVRIIDYGPDLTEGTSDDLAWNGSSWVSTGTTGYVYVDNFDGTNWSISSISWNGNRKYRVKSRAEHTGNGLTEPESIGREFIIDSSAPVVLISTPSLSYYKNIDTLVGSVSDVSPGVIVNTYFRVKRSDADEYWNWKLSTFTASCGTGGADCQLVATLNAGVATYTTDYFVNGLAWEENRSYVVQLYSIDKAGNVGIASEKTFTIDRTSPTATITIPVDENNSGIRELTKIEGNASDNYANSKVYIAIRKLAPTPVWWDGSGFTITGDVPNWIDVTAAGYLSPNATYYYYNPANLNAQLASDYRYLILVKARDVATNEQDVGISSKTIKVDKDKPISAISRPLNNGAYKSSLIGKTANSTQLSGTATDYPDNVYAGVVRTQIRLSYIDSGTTYYYNGTSFVNISSESAWLNTSVSGSGKTKNWDYMTDVNWPSGDKEYTLEVKSMDDSRLADDTGDGNEEIYPYVSVKFIVDDTPPTVSITTPTDGSKLNYTPVVSGNSDASLSGLNGVEIKVSSWSAGNWQLIGTYNADIIYQSSWSWTGLSGLISGTTYQIVARALDRAG